MSVWKNSIQFFEIRNMCFHFLSSYALFFTFSENEKKIFPLQVCFAIDNFMQ